MKQDHPDLIFCGNEILLERGSPLRPAVGAAALERLHPRRMVVEEALVHPQEVSAVWLDGKADRAPEGMDWMRIRQALALGLPWSGVAARALGLLNWCRKHHYCGACGGPLRAFARDMGRPCAQCGRITYPDVSPCVIVRVEKEGRILLARHARRNMDVFTCLAGHVDAGESAEECVHREVREETGLEIGAVRYLGSQYWPHANQLMLAFSARWTAGRIQIQEEELTEAGWFDPLWLPPVPPPGSVAYKLIHQLI
ncbi:MAG: NAD(+) diphosphatase [Verrucomicrobiota bacterium]|nr:NAD(+) diphosphatase [Verrucomicrobiota bacterium]